VTARLETFVGSLGDISPQDFLAQEKIKGLAGFQNDVAQIIAEIANQNSTLCDLDGLQALVDEELAQLDNQSLLSSYLVSTIRFGGTRERSDVLAGPDNNNTILAAPATATAPQPLSALVDNEDNSDN
jgi:hypothetical protein